MALATVDRIPTAESRPGLTSLIKTGRGIMTVQTEVLGDPSRLVTIVDYRGRVLKTWESGFLIDPADVAGARRWHQLIERDVRDSLTRAAQRGSSRSTSVGAVLYIEAVRAYASGDYERARSALDACARLLPDDARVESALARLHAVEVH